MYQGFPLPSRLGEVVCIFKFTRNSFTTQKPKRKKNKVIRNLNKMNIISEFVIVVIIVTKKKYVKLVGKSQRAIVG